MARKRLPPNAESNPYRSPDSGNTKEDLWKIQRDLIADNAFVEGLVQAVAWAAMGAAALRIVPKFKKIFVDFGVEPPVATAVLIQVASFLSHYWFLPLLLVLCWPWLYRRIVLALSPRPEVAWLRWLWSFVTWSALPLMAVFGVIALLRPLMGLISRLS